jgi:hypothetical protein
MYNFVDRQTNCTNFVQNVVYMSLISNLATERQSEFRPVDKINVVYK